VQNAARTDFLLVGWILLSGIVQFLRLFFGVEVIEIAEAFMKP
jgi:hypothetical protein